MKLFGNNSGKKPSRAAQIKTALSFLLATVALAALILIVLSPATPSALFPVAVRFCMSKLDITDNGVSDWYEAGQLVDGDDFALSLLPDIPSGYETAIDYLRYVNREFGVNRIILNIPSEAAELLNEGLQGGLDASYYALVSGSFCASVEFRDFCAKLRLLNSVIIPESRFCFIGMAEDWKNAYSEASSAYATCLLMSREEAHSEEGPGRFLESEGASYVMTDILYTSALTSSGQKYSDFYETFLEKGSYLAFHSKLNFLKSWHAFALKASRRVEKRFSAVDGPGGDFFILVAGSDQIYRKENTEDGDVIDYEVGPGGFNPDDTVSPHSHGDSAETVSEEN